MSDLFSDQLRGTETVVGHTCADGKTLWWGSAIELTPVGRFRCPILNEGPFPTAEAAERAIDAHRAPGDRSRPIKRGAECAA